MDYSHFLADFQKRFDRLTQQLSAKKFHEAEETILELRVRVEGALISLHNQRLKEELYDLAYRRYNLSDHGGSTARAERGVPEESAHGAEKEAV